MATSRVVDIPPEGEDAAAAAAAGGYGDGELVQKHSSIIISNSNKSSSNKSCSAENGDGDGDEIMTMNSAQSKGPSRNTSYSSIPKTLSFFRNPFPSTARLHKPRNFLLAYQSLGIVYAGVGTCPLYVMSSFKLDKPAADDYLGVFSIVFWTFTLISLVKYAFIILRADDHGEGGTFALYSILCQHTNISRYGRVPKKVVKTMPKEGSVQAKTIKFMERSKAAQLCLFIFTMMGACMVIGDGILTPAISVLSAVDGLRNASHVFNTTSIVIITTLLLIALFMVQRFGTSKVGFLFSPTVAIWFLTTSLIGIYNVAVHNPSVFKAISPHYMFKFFLDRKLESWKVLSGTVLCITSSEAMYADLGHFNRISMQMAFVFVTYPACILMYAGQTAYLTLNLDNEGVFYKSIPTPVYWPMFIIATLTAIVASQCLISACFSLVKQSIALDLFPKVQLIHTSEDHEGQIYSPEANYFLMVLCVLVVVGLRSVDSLGHAYGVTVIIVMFITTFFAGLVMVVVWNISLPLVLAFVIVYGSIEGVYISSVLSKIAQGGWLPFVVSIFIGVIMFTWIFGRATHNRYEKANMVRVKDVISLMATSTSGVTRVPGLCIFYCDFDDEVPPLMRHYLDNIRSLHKIVIFTTVNFCKIPKIPARERYRFLGDSSGLYRCMAYYGYAEERKIAWSEFRECMIDSLRDYIRSRDSGQRSVEDLDFYEEDFVALREEEHHHHQHHHAKGQPIINNNNNNNNINSHQQRGSAVAPNQPSMEEEEEEEKNAEVETTVLQEMNAGTATVVAPRERSRAWKAELVTLESVRALDPVLVIGKARLVFSRQGIRFWAQRVFLDVIYRFLYANSTSPATSLILSVPPTNLVEISMHYQV